MIFAPDHVAPLSLERMKATLKPRILCEFLKLKMRSKKSKRSPFGRTTIWFPIVWLIVPGS